MGAFIYDQINDADNFALLFNGYRAAHGIHGISLVIHICLFVVQEALSCLKCAIYITLFLFQVGIYFKNAVVNRFFSSELYNIGIGSIKVPYYAIFIYNHQPVYIVYKPQILFEIFVHKCDLPLYAYPHYILHSRSIQADIFSFALLLLCFFQRKTAGKLRLPFIFWSNQFFRSFLILFGHFCIFTSSEEFVESKGKYAD